METLKALMTWSMLDPLEIEEIFLKEITHGPRFGCLAAIHVCEQTDAEPRDSRFDV